MSLYFIPSRVANQFKNIVKKSDITMPILKRKLTAMVWATHWRREVINEEARIYLHRFNQIAIVVEEHNSCIHEVYLDNSVTKFDSRSSHYYHQNCRCLGLNNSHKDFSQESKSNYQSKIA